MIKCFITLCLLSNPTMCQPPLEITPADGKPITSPMDCARGAFIYFSQPRMAQLTPEGIKNGEPINATQWFPKVNSRLYGDGSDIVRAWVAEEKRQIKAMEPQIK